MAKKVNYDFWDCVRKMPSLKNGIPGQPYDVNFSQAALWIVSQPNVINKVFRMAINRKVITYAPNTHTWQGVDYCGN